ncbi:MAG: peptidoglycan-binding protein [Cyanobacteria bacterium P01_A01_bin.84]
MRLCHFSILITYFTCLGLNPSYASIARNDLLPESYQISQVNSASNTSRALLKPGNIGDDVKKLQTQLKQLGHYSEVVDGVYRKSTRTAIAKFQKAKGLNADGIAGETTQNAILKAIKEKEFENSSTKPPDSQSNTGKKQSSKRDIIVWSLIAIATLGSLGMGLYFLKFSGRKQENIPQGSDEENTASSVNTQETPQSNKVSDSESQKTHPTSRLTKVDIVDKLIKDIQSTDPNKRRKAIWDLGQKGDSRAIQPMIDYMVHVDSQQRSLILAALAEIGDRTLQPMNRALAISMQDDSPQVRQNAIRDITRIYDTMAQISQMLSYALEDSDPQVQETAKYALTQMNRIRNLPVNRSNSTPELSKESISEFNNVTSIGFPELGNAHQNGNHNGR